MKSFILVINAALWMGGSVSSAQTVDWNALPEMVSKTPATEAAQWQVRAAEARTGSLRRSFQPKVNVGLAEVAGAPTTGGSASPGEVSNWTEGSAELGLNLWRGNQDQHKDDAALAEARASNQEAMRGYNQHLLEARQAWLEVWMAAKQLEVLTTVGEQIKEDRQRAAKKANAGLTSQTDVTEFELRGQELDLELARAEEEKDAAGTRLAARLGLEAQAIELGAGIERGPEPPNAPGSVAGPDEQSFSAQSAARTAEAASQGRWPFPSIDTGLKGLLGAPDGSLAGSQGYEARLGLSLALWDSGQARSERDYFEAQSKALAALAEGARRERLAQIGFLQRKVVRWNALAPTLEERLKMAQEFRDKVTKEYVRGVKDARDLEGATQAVASAGVALSEAKVASWESWAELKGLEAQESSKK